MSYMTLLYPLHYLDSCDVYMTLLYPLHYLDSCDVLQYFYVMLIGSLSHTTTYLTTYVVPSTVRLHNSV